MSLAEVFFVLALLVVGDVLFVIALGFFLAGDGDDDEDNRPNYL